MHESGNTRNENKDDDNFTKDDILRLYLYRVTTTIAHGRCIYLIWIQLDPVGAQHARDAQQISQEAEGGEGVSEQEPAAAHERSARTAAAATSSRRGR